MSSIMEKELQEFVEKSKNKAKEYKTIFDDLYKNQYKSSIKVAQRYALWSLYSLTEKGKNEILSSIYDTDNDIFELEILVTDRELIDAIVSIAKSMIKSKNNLSAEDKMKISCMHESEIVYRWFTGTLNPKWPKYLKDKYIGYLTEPIYEKDDIVLSNVPKIQDRSIWITKVEMDISCKVKLTVHAKMDFEKYEKEHELNT